MRHEPITFANVAGSGPDGSGTAVTLSDFISEQFDPALSWDDLDWFRAEWEGSILLKGVQTVEDAVTAVQRGADGVVLSNHGGRQLDGAPAPLRLVRPVRDALGDGATVICDGGVRRGGDIVKAVALGADACTMGRTYLYGLGAAGEAGVERALTMLTDELRRAMQLCGVRSLAEIGPDLVEELR